MQTVTKELEMVPEIVQNISKLSEENQKRILWIAQGMVIANDVKEAKK